MIPVTSEDLMEVRLQRRAAGTTHTRHPEVVVRLTGTDGNAFAFLAHVRHELLRAGVPEEETEQFITEAENSGSYAGLLATCMNWVTVL